MHLRTTVAALAVGCLIVVPAASVHGATPVEQPAKAAANACPGKWDHTKSAPIRTKSGARWGTSMTKVRGGGDDRGFCGKVVLPKRFHNKQTVVTAIFREYAKDGAQLGLAGGQSFGSELGVVTFIGSGILSGEYARLNVTMTAPGGHAKAKTLRVTMP
jgi:hypothetical protein